MTTSVTTERSVWVHFKTGALIEVAFASGFLVTKLPDPCQDMLVNMESHAKIARTGSLLLLGHPDALVDTIIQDGTLQGYIAEWDTYGKQEWQGRNVIVRDDRIRYELMQPEFPGFNTILSKFLQIDEPFFSRHVLPSLTREYENEIVIEKRGGLEMRAPADPKRDQYMRICFPGITPINLSFTAIGHDRHAEFHGLLSRIASARQIN